MNIPVKMKNIFYKPGVTQVNKSLLIFYAVITIESPPRVWGKAIRANLKISRKRITPTCVGKSDYLCSFQRVRKDHPHVCGEKTRKQNRIERNYGSPPRVWGKVGRRINTGIGVRITPTCVGKSY